MPLGKDFSQKDHTIFKTFLKYIFFCEVLLAVIYRELFFVSFYILSESERMGKKNLSNKGGREGVKMHQNERSGRYGHGFRRDRDIEYRTTDDIIRSEQADVFNKVQVTDSEIGSEEESTNRVKNKDDDGENSQNGDQYLQDSDDDTEDGDVSGFQSIMVQLSMWEFGQNDAKRDSGSKLCRMGYARVLRIGQTFPGIVLSSEASTFVSSLDKPIVETHGIAGINCSWNRLEEIPFDRMGKGRNQVGKDFSNLLTLLHVPVH